MHPAGESFLFDQEQKYRSVARKKEQTSGHLLDQQHPSIMAQIGNFFNMLNHIRRIRIQVTFEYQEPCPETVVGYKPTI